MSKFNPALGGFASPNYTQSPNDFYDMIPDMSDAELRVTNIMIRQTFGFHRNTFKMSVGKLAKAAGLSRQGALDGSEAAEKRGTFVRVNPNSITEAEWMLAVQPLQPVEGDIQPVEGTPPVSGGQVGVKESNKERLKNGGVPPYTVEKIQATSLDWQLEALSKGWITPEQLKIHDRQTLFEHQVSDAANLIDMQAAGTGPLALAFMLTRNILFTDDQIKGQRKAAREMLKHGVRPEHVIQATKDLMSARDKSGRPFTITSLFHISETAIGLANPAPVEAEKDTRQALPVFEDGKPVFK